MRLNEVGATYNKSNLKLLKDAYTALKTAIANFVDPDSEDTPAKDTPAKDTPAKEASGFSQNDLVTALQAELADLNKEARICDIYTDDKTLVYTVGWYNNACYQVSYTIDDTGVASFSDPIEVSRKVTYVAKSDNASPADNIADQGAMAATDEALIISDPINLIESAVQPDGTVMLKLISPGWGSSGYYSSEVLKRDGPKVFTEGLHNFIDHPTPEEERLRPEGSLTKLGSTLIEDAKWYDDFKGFGPGLYAKAKANPSFASTLNVIAPHIGTSIRAGGKVSQGVIEGRSGPIVEQLTVGKSVDYVTRAGAGGKVLTLLESARQQLATTDKGDTMGHSEDIARLTEANTTLQQQVSSLLEAQQRNMAKGLISQQLSQYATLPTSTRARLIENISNLALPITDVGTLDTAKLSEAVTAAVTAEVAYLAKLGVGGVRGLGNSKPIDLAEIDMDKEWQELDKLF
jgi:hypothetical protein